METNAFRSIATLAFRSACFRSSLNLGWSVVVLGAALVVNFHDAIGAPPVAEFQKKGTGGVRAISRLPDQDVIIIGTQDGVIRLWNFKDNRILGEMNAGLGPVGSLASDRKGRWIAAAYQDHVICIWDTKKLTLEKRIRHDSIDTRTKIIVGHDGDTLITYGHLSTLSVWSIAKAEETRILTGHEQSVTAAAIMEDSAVLVSADADWMLISWNLESGKVSYRVRGGGLIGSIAVIQGARAFASGGNKPGIEIRNARMGRIEKVIDKSEEFHWAIRSSPDGKLLAGAFGNGYVGIWEVESGNRVQKISAHYSVITGVEFSRDGTMLITSCGGVDFRDREIDGQVRVWKIN